MRKRYRQNPTTGKLEYVGQINQAPYASDTFAAGDIPDMMKDVERNKRDLAKREARARKQTIIDNVNRYL